MKLSVVNRCAQLVTLSIFCLACLRSMLEASSSFDHPVRPNHWKTTAAKTQELSTAVQKCTDPKTKRELERKLAQLYKQNNNLYEASVLMTKEWNQGVAEDDGKFNQQFMENSDSLSGLYVIEGNLDHAQKCYESLLGYDKIRSGANNELVARDYNNIGVATYLAATAAEASKKEKLLNSSLNYFKQSGDILQQLKSTKNDEEILKSNIAFAERERKF